MIVPIYGLADNHNFTLNMIFWFLSQEVNDFLIHPILMPNKCKFHFFPPMLLLSLYKGYVFCHLSFFSLYYFLPPHLPYNLVFNLSCYILLETCSWFLTSGLWSYNCSDAFVLKEAVPRHLQSYCIISLCTKSSLCFKCSISLK